MKTVEAAAAAHLDDARCADLALGLLAPDAAARDLAHAADCPACEARLRAHTRAHDRARARRAAGIGAAMVSQPARAWWRRPVVGLAAAAALAVAVGAPFYTRHPTRFGAAAPWLPTGSGVVQRAAAGDPHLTAGLAAYARHDVATAERELAAAKASGSAEAARRVFLASAVLARGDAERAIVLLESVDFEIDVPEPWRTAGLRTLEVAWRRAGRTPQADSLAHALDARESGERP